MLDQLEEKLQPAREKVESVVVGDPDDETNTGITSTEALIGFAAAMGITLLTRKLLEEGWEQVLDKAPPKNPSSHEVAWREAIAWGVLSGALVGVARIASRRAATGIYRKLEWG